MVRNICRLIVIACLLMSSGCCNFWLDQLANSKTSSQETRAMDGLRLSCVHYSFHYADAEGNEAPRESRWLGSAEYPYLHVHCPEIGKAICHKTIARDRNGGRLACRGQ